MSREPSLHIGKSDVRNLLTSVFNIEPSDADMDYLFEKAQPYQIRNRGILYGTAKTKESFTKQVGLSSKEVPIFNSILVERRKAAKHQFIDAIRTDDKLYLTLKEITKDAVDFCKMFHVEHFTEGFKTYIDIGLKLIGKKYSLNKFKYYKNKIFEIGESLIVIDRDDNKAATNRFFKEWKEAMSVRAGVYFTSMKSMGEDKYVHFVYGRQEADEAGAKYEDWIAAQFEELAWTESIPELSQFYGDNACNRYNKYCLDNELKSAKRDKKETTISKDSTDSEKAYWEALRKNKAT